MTKIQLRRDTAANWMAANPILASGEPALETDTRKRKTGDGVTVWTTLAYDLTGGGAAANATTTATGSVQLAGDLAGTAAAPVVARVNGVSATGTPAVGQVFTATSASAATWQAPPAGPAGPTGPTGAAGAAGTSGVAATVTVGTTTTGAAGTNAAVTNTGTTSAALFAFTVPQGAAGTAGVTGATGVAGATGPTGATGTAGAPGTAGTPGAAATVTVGTTTTGAAGTSATVTNTGTTSAAALAFIVPQGAAGAAGVTGATGSAGATGATGPTGAASTVAGPAGATGATGATGSAGSTGAAGAAGVAATVTVGTTTTGAAGTSAAVTNTGTTSAATFAFTVPQGAAGVAGTAGATGTAGTPGVAATVTAGTTTTGAAGTAATVTNTGTSSAAVLNFVVPQGVAGSGATNATTTAVGSVQLAGDLAGTALAPTVPGLAAKAPLLIPTVVKTTVYTAVSGDLVRADATTASFAVTLPAAVVGSTLAVKKVDTSVNTITITPAGTDTIDGLTSAVLRIPNATQRLIAVVGGWVVADGFNALSALDARYAPVVEAVNTVTTSGAAQTLPDVSTATVSRITLTAACTLTFPTPAAGKSLTLALVQDATGGRTVVWPGTVAWAGGTVPTVTAAANKRDVFTFLALDATSWLGFVAGLNY